MIEPLRPIPTEMLNGIVESDRFPNDKELMDKINEIIEHLNNQEDSYDMDDVSWIWMMYHE